MGIQNERRKRRDETERKQKERYGAAERHQQDIRGEQRRLTAGIFSSSSDFTVTPDDFTSFQSHETCDRFSTSSNSFLFLQEVLDQPDFKPSESQTGCCPPVEVGCRSWRLRDEGAGGETEVGSRRPHFHTGWIK